jgi:hypothetical protein
MRSGGGKSLLDYLGMTPEPRRRYPLDGLSAVLIQAALHGESSLRRM